MSCSTNSCKLNDPSDLYNSNCCCIAFWYNSSDEDAVATARKYTFGFLVAAYGLAIIYSIYDLGIAFADKVRRRKVGIRAFVKSHKFAVSLVSFLALSAGTASCWFHYSSFMCFAGLQEGCIKGPSKAAIHQFKFW